MKKSFMFVAVAAAGMLASCSSDSLTAGPDPNIEPTQEERVPIQLGVSAPSVNLASGTTRGTGTVGGVGVTNDDPTNVWYGQKINAFMFVKNSLDLAVENETGPVYFYNDAVMITPGTADNQIPGLSTPTNIGEAMLSNGDIKYYPGSGNFDFFGYHGAGVTSNLTKTDGLWTVDFTIDGSQDLMSTKAVLTDAQTAKMGGSTDFYSAKAARKEVQPILSFNHLLTRLAFEVKAGNDNAGGWVAGTHDASSAAMYNATLVGHHAATEELSAEETATYNSKLPGALQAGVALDATQLAAYNSAIDPDKSEGDELTTDEANAYNATLGGALTSGTALTAENAAAYNAKLPSVVAADDDTGLVGYIMLAPPSITNDNGFKYHLLVKLKTSDGSTNTVTIDLEPPVVPESDPEKKDFEAGKIYNIIVNVQSPEVISAKAVLQGWQTYKDDSHNPYIVYDTE